MSMLDKEPKQVLIFDVGLHRGEDTEFYLKKGFRVVAFEPNPELVSLCTKRFEEFIHRRQLRIVCGAIVEPTTLKPRQRKVRFYRNESSSRWGTVCLAWGDRNENSGHPSHSIEVDAIDFSQALREHGILHYISKLAIWDHAWNAIAQRMGLNGVDLGDPRSVLDKIAHGLFGATQNHRRNYGVRAFERLLRLAGW